MQLHSAFEVYPKISLRSPKVSPRSRLFTLEPIGIGTPLVESMTSYISRLAGEYDVSTFILARDEIFRIIKKRYYVSSDVMFTFNRNINGMGVIAQDWMNAVSELTCCDMFSNLNMTLWNGVFTNRGLLRKNKAWCKYCYSEWKINGKIIYDPLLWKLAAVKCCHIHKAMLSEHCIKCNAVLPHINKSCYPAYCYKCKSPVFEQIPAGHLVPQECVSDTDKRELWIAFNLGEVIANASSLAPMVSRETIFSIIKFCIDTLATGNAEAFARALDISGDNVREWNRGDNMPQLAYLASISHWLGIPLKDFIVGNTAAIGDIEKRRQMISSLYDKKMERLKYSHRRKTKKDIKKMIKVFKEAINSNSPISMDEFKKKAGTHEKSSNPEIIKLREELLILRRRHREKNRTISKLALKRKLEEAIASTSEPVSVNDLAKKLGFDRARLYQLYPDKCHLIAEKNKIYLKERRLEYRDRNKRAVRKIVTDLCDNGIYPSLKKTREMFCGTIDYKVLNEARNEALTGLNVSKKLFNRK